MKTKPEILKSIRELVSAYREQFVVSSFDPKNPVVRLHEPTYGTEEIMAALEPLLTTQITMGEKVYGFEDEFSKTMKGGKSLMVNSGSSANLLAVSALVNPVYERALKDGDEVIVPALCWSTTVWPLIQNRLVPVIVDIDPKTLNIDPEEIKKAITPKTRAIVLVHVYGNPCDMNEIMAIAKENRLLVMEDGCEALGSFYRKTPVGTFGEVSTFSFYFSHHITTLEGGMCVTKDPNLWELMNILRAHGWVRQTGRVDAYTKKYPGIDPKFLFVNLGYNFRATELQGAMGSFQLKKLPGLVKKRRENATYWTQELKTFSKYVDFQEETDGGEHSWFGFSVILKTGAPFDVKQMTTYLNGRGIETRPIIAGNIAAQPAMKLYAHRNQGALSHSDHIMNRAFSIGCHQDVTPAAREYVSQAFHDFFKSLSLR